jgi:hypothetical protein
MDASAKMVAGASVLSILLALLLKYVLQASSTAWVILGMLAAGEGMMWWFKVKRWCMLLMAPLLWGALAVLYLLKNGSPHAPALLTLIALFCMHGVLQFGVNNKVVVEGMGNQALRYFGLFAAVVLVLLYLYTWNPGNVADSMAMDFIGVAIGLAVGLFVLVVVTEYTSYLAKHDQSVPAWAIGLSNMLTLGGGVFVLVALFVLFGKYVIGNFQLGSGEGGFSVTTLARNLLTIVLLVALMGAVLKFTDAYLSKNPFYEYIKAACGLATCSAKESAKTADRRAMKWLGVVVGMCLLYAVLALLIGPAVKKWFYGRHSTVLQNAPVPLSTETAIAPTVGTLEENKFSHTVSAWFYIDSFALSTRKSYGDGWKRVVSFKGNPEVVYDATANAMHVRVTDRMGANETVYTQQDVALQRWNNVVFNYGDGGVLDVFFNGKLVKSDVRLTVPYWYNDTILVGSRGGPNGSVANVMYFDKMQSAYDIEQLYALYAGMSAPVVDES